MGLSGAPRPCDGRRAARAAGFGGATQALELRGHLREVADEQGALGLARVVGRPQDRRGMHGRARQHQGGRTDLFQFGLEPRTARQLLAKVGLAVDPALATKLELLPWEGGMQTFLPYAGFDRTARALDLRRLGKQRVEALQVLRGQLVPGYGWRHHPAVKMWLGHEEALAAYGVAICREWIRRGHADTVLGSIVEALGREPRPQVELRRLGLLPPWLGNAAFHRAHRSSLVRKDPVWYGPMFPGVPDDLPYIWPGR